MFKGTIICGVIFLLWAYLFTSSIIPIGITCFVICITHYITKQYLDGWLITDKIDDDPFSGDGKGEKDKNEEGNETQDVFPTPLSQSEVNGWNDLNIHFGVNGRVKKGIIVKKNGLTIKWMITCVDFITKYAESTIHVINFIRSIFIPTSSQSSTSHGNRNIGSTRRSSCSNSGKDGDVTGRGGGGGAREAVTAAESDVNEVVMKLPSSQLTTLGEDSAGCLSTLDSIVKELINDYILIWFQTIHTDSSSLTSCDFIQDCHSLLLSIFTQIINDHITGLNINRIYHKLVDVIIHHFEEGDQRKGMDEEMKSGSKKKIMRSQIRRGLQHKADQHDHQFDYDNAHSSSSHYNNWVINQNFEYRNSSDEEIIDRLDGLLDFLLCSVAPADLINLKLIKCDDIQSRDSLYLMVKEILLFGVSIPIVNIISEPDFINTGIFKIVSKTFHEGDHTEGDKHGSPTKFQMTSFKNMYLSTASGYLDSSTPKSRATKAFDSVASPITRANSEYFPVTRRSMQSMASREDSFVARHSGLEMGLNVDDDQFSRIQLFANIRIPEAHEAGTRGDKFIVYTVVYDGLFEQVETAGINKAAVFCLVRKQVTIYRRFSEFLLLHSKLAQNRTFKSLLRNIRDPFKLKSYSVFKSKVGKSLTDLRKSFLALYLNELASIDLLENSQEFREFLSYEATDGPVNFVSGIVKDISSLIVPLRIDKVIVGGFKGAVSLIKTVFPIEPLTEDSCYFPGTGFGTSHFRMEYFIANGKMAIESILDQVVDDDGHDILQIRDDFSQSVSFDESSQFCDSAAGALIQEHLPTRSTTKSQVHLPLIDSLSIQLIQYFPLASPTIDLIFFLRNLTSNISFVALTCKLLFGNLIETLLQRQSKKTLTKENFSVVLELLRESIWPNDELDIHDMDGHMAVKLDARARPTSPKKLKKLLIKFLETRVPFFKHFVNDPRILVPFFISRLQKQDLNKILIYDLLDVIYQEMKHSKSV